MLAPQLSCWLITQSCACIQNLATTANDPPSQRHGSRSLLACTVGIQDRGLDESQLLLSNIL
jgi:hypothetical protein